MIVWIASYPRSGNGLTRQTLAERYGRRTGPMPELGEAGSDGLERSQLPEELDRGPAPTFVQTHRLGDAASAHPAIYLVRDGRDALVSYAAYVADRPEEHPSYRGLELDVICERLIAGHPGWGSWSQNARSWIGREAPTAVVHFEDLIEDPLLAVSAAAEELGIELPEPTATASERVPAGELLRPRFGAARRGRVGSWRGELPRTLARRFWARHGTTMAALGYDEEHPSAPRRRAGGSTLRPSTSPRGAQPPGGGPAVLHVTHWKAGSQWIYSILRRLRSAIDLVEPEPHDGHVAGRPIRPGAVYPTVYLDRERYEALELPADARPFVVIRDPRDTLVSAYFSLKLSHRAVGRLEPDGEEAELRSELRRLPLTAGLRATLEGWRLDEVAEIQRSWLAADAPLVRYEELIDRDEELLTGILLDRCGLGVERAALVGAIRASRFDRARAPGSGVGENPYDHLRQGRPGAWRQYFSAELAARFKERFAGLLIEAGYERDDAW